MRIVPNAFIFARVAARHYVNLVIPFSKPNRCGDGNAILAEGSEADVFLALKLAWDGHRYILRHEHL